MKYKINLISYCVNGVIRKLDYFQEVLHGIYFGINQKIYHSGKDFLMHLDLKISNEYGTI